MGQCVMGEVRGGEMLLTTGKRDREKGVRKNYTLLEDVPQ